MASPVHGRVHGTSIELDAPLPELEGKRVVVLVEELGSVLSKEEQQRAWDEWVRGGPQGPIDDDGEAEFP
ncbi:MAG TPA: hypothetical protein VGG39_34025 [Polyangiaceae bacterium]|jgi:hypothetical protein